MTLIPNLNLVPIIQRLVTRDRMGRMLTFLSRIRVDYAIKEGSVSRAVGVDEHTALLLDINTGTVETVGVGTAYVCASDHSASICLDGVPLTFTGISIGN